MAITTLQQLTDLATQSKRRAWRSANCTGGAGTMNGQWTLAAQTGMPLGSGLTNPVGAVPPTGAGAICDRTTQGAIVVPGAAPSGGNKIYLVRWLPTWGSGRQRIPVLIDRLVATSGLSGTVTTAQAVNSVALPSRITASDYVEAAIEFYTATGATATTATVIYTDSGGVSRTVTVNIPASPAAGHMELIPHLAGTQYRGIASVQSVQLAATTGTVGNFGITLFRRIAHGRQRIEQDPLDWRSIGIPTVAYDACLQMAYLIDASGAMLCHHEMLFAEA